jgi:hypothetical protein
MKGICLKFFQELSQGALIIPAPISTTSVFERIVVSGIAKILKYKDTFKIAKNHK